MAESLNQKSGTLGEVVTGCHADQFKSSLHCPSLNYVVTQAVLPLACQLLNIFILKSLVGSASWESDVILYKLDGGNHVAYVTG